MYTKMYDTIISPGIYSRTYCRTNSWTFSNLFNLWISSYILSFQIDFESSCKLHDFFALLLQKLNV